VKFTTNARYCNNFQWKTFPNSSFNCKNATTVIEVHTMRYHILLAMNMLNNEKGKQAMKRLATRRGNGVTELVTLANRHIN